MDHIRTKVEARDNWEVILWTETGKKNGVDQISSYKWIEVSEFVIFI